MKNLYNLLEISADASVEDIKNAFRKKAKELHPDVNKNPNAHQNFIDVSEAYEILKSPILRLEYDEMYKKFIVNQGKKYNGHAYEDFKTQHQNVYEDARHYSDISIDEVMESIRQFALKIGKEILIGETGRPKLSVGGFISMGFWGLFFIAGIVMLFTGIGTIPGVAMVYIGGKSFFKGNKFYGILPMILSTLLNATVIILVISIWIFNLI